jgi:hypothetical protein
MVRARSRGHFAWADLCVLIFCYGLAFIIDGTFDVALEGPMAGIWFWSLFGVGIGATMIYRASLADLGGRVASSGSREYVKQTSWVCNALFPASQFMKLSQDHDGRS